MRSAIFLALVASFAHATPPMSFNCADGMQDICDNMCWGAYCTEPSFGVTLNYDNYGGSGDRKGSVGKSRTDSAGCTPNPNRCSTKHNPPNPKAGENCDEYPFASTKDADKGGQVTKCVISRHNSRQGKIIKDYVQSSCGGKPCTFIVGFGNPAASGVKYCMAYQDRYNKCVPDQTIFKNGKPDIRPPKSKRDLDNSTATIPGGLYLLKSGMKVAFGEHLDIGTLTKRAEPRNATLARREDIAWDFHDDEIVARLE
ncbi:hypothetical protein F5Y04DRAFT_282577 [Hypomontagnella monticulosa]|nr:hypothetical protein F5Y04DRAFT_282577 [Hypomontagnella monticulosa]